MSTATTAPARPADLRIKALRRFAMAITTLNILGHLILGFEMAYAHPFVALFTAYVLELGLELVDARLHARPLAFLGGGLSGFIDFLLPSHITALACAMLVYSNETYWPIVFAVAVGVCSKYIFRAPTGKGRTSHIFNPSNTGIAATLVAFPWIAASPPYQFTENVSGAWDWIIPCIIITTGTLLNWKLTKKMPLIFGWVVGFAAQAIFRGVFMDFNLLHALSSMTGVAFVLFTFYMVTDPGTTPSIPRNQVIFGASVAFVYMFIDIFNVVYQIFFALLIVCTVRGILLYAFDWYRTRQAERTTAVAPVSSTTGGI